MLTTKMITGRNCEGMSSTACISIQSLQHARNMMKMEHVNSRSSPTSMDSRSNPVVDRVISKFLMMLIEIRCFFTAIGWR